MTRAALTTKRSKQETQEKKMRLFKHPAITAIIVLAFLAIAAPVAYAIVDRVWLSVDVESSPEEIESSVRSQLESAGVNANVKATKSGDRIDIRIETPDKSAGSNIDVAVTNLPDDAIPVQLRMEVLVPISDAQMTLLTTTTTSDAFTALLDADVPDAAKLKQALADAGFKQTEVLVSPTGVTIKILAAPQ